MSNNKPINREMSRKRLTGKPVVRDKDYYLNSIDIQDSLLKKATSIAERMFAAFVRENNTESSMDLDDLADKIVKKIEPKLQSVRVKETYTEEKEDLNSFSFDDDDPVVMKTGNSEIKGADKIKKTSKSKDSISDNLDILKDFEL